MRGKNFDVKRMAQAVREKRKARKLSQKELGEVFGLSQTYVGWLELGNARRLNEKMVRDILSYLQLDIADFIEEGEPEAKPQPRPKPEPKHKPEPAIERVIIERKAPAPEALPEPEEKKWKEGRAAEHAPKEGQSFGKERRRFLEWVREKTRIGIRLNNGEVLEGYIKWWDTYSLKFISGEQELVIPKHSVLYYIDAPKKQ